MKLSALLAPLIAAKADHDTIMQVVIAFEAEQNDALEKRRESDRKRQSEKRSRDVTLRHSDGSLTCGGDARGLDNNLPKKIITKEEKKEGAPAALDGFDDFWSLFPNRVGKRDAEKAFANARRRAALEAILAGVERYAAKTDDRPWCNPATFLNQDRWADQPATAPPRQATSPPSPREPRNAGERAFLKLQGQTDEPPSPANGRLDPGDGRRQIEGSGIARRFAVSAGARG